MPSKPGDFVQLMIGCQSRLYAFIMSLVCDPDQAADILQQTNLVMWEKSDQFTPGTNFSAWAYQIARYQVMAYRQRRRRDRHVFDDETLAAVASVFEERAEGLDDKLTALSHCMNQLSDDARTLIRTRYRDGFSVKQIADQLGHSANRVAVRLHRLRLALMECMQRGTLPEAIET
jgi:RNA polymerase sigma-70 factor (ECF subfamily)